MAYVAALFPMASHSSGERARFVTAIMFSRGSIGLNEAFGELILTLLYYTLLTENTSKSAL